MGMIGHRKRKVAIVGATGVTGQQFLAALADHPRLEVTRLAASARSAGRAYADAITTESGGTAWFADGTLPARFAGMVVEQADKLDPTAVDLVFSCVEAAPARELEPLYAQHTPVISTASAFRREPDVPVIVPGVNFDHAKLIDHQRTARGWKGFITPNPNCTTVGLAISLAPLYRQFGVDRVHMVSLQSVSGAGRSPGVIGLDILDNVVPYIPKEEEKVEWETQKILGTLRGTEIVRAELPISSTCTRVGVLEGHTEVVHLELGKDASAEAITAAWRGFGKEHVGRFPSAPPVFIDVSEDPYRPQPRLDRDAGAGMTTTIGRLRKDTTSARGWKYVLVSHNTKMGAAGGCILLAEYLDGEGYLGA